MYLGLIMLFYNVYQLWDMFCCAAKMQLGSPVNPTWCKGTPSIPCNKPGLSAKMSDATLSYATSLKNWGR